MPVDAEALEQPARTLGEDLAAGYVLSVFRNGEAADVARSVLLVRRPGVGDIEEALVGRKGEAVRPSIPNSFDVRFLAPWDASAIFGGVRGES